MFERITPEEAGLSSARVAEFIRLLERRGAITHSVLMMKGDKIFAEYYWAPFHQDFNHRMYSVTKSFEGVAIGLLEEEGKLSLDDRIADHFPERIECDLPQELREQTIRNMLTMSTIGNGEAWFTAGDPDRVHLYFNGKRPFYRPAGSYWHYDSAGSQVLSALVEKLSGMSLLDYLKLKLFDKMGTFRNATVLKTPNGESWGDSAMICTTRDLASFARFVMNYGTWNGERLMNERYLKEATSKVVDNRQHAHNGYDTQGYGYQIWQTEQDSFSFQGMGGQFAICVPKKDLIFVITGDNQGANHIYAQYFGAFFDMIAAPIRSKPLKPNVAAEKRLAKATSDLKLFAVQGNADSPMRREISGKTYLCRPNRCGMKQFSFVFHDAEHGEFRYTNEQGDKVIPFGVNHNVFGKFPQFGYSNDVGAVRTTDGFLYDDAVSLCWAQDNRILMYVQIIDRYFGNCSMIFGFKNGVATCHFEKSAEDFLNEYYGDFFADEQK